MVEIVKTEVNITRINVKKHRQRKEEKDKLKMEYYMSKVIVIDSSGLYFPAVFSWERQIIKQQETNSDMFIMSPIQVYFSSLISCLKKIGVDEDTKVIIALEGKSWRKKYYAPYKAQREGDRQKHEAIDWDKCFKELNDFHDLLDRTTDWQFIREWDSECDDILSVACRHFKDDEVIIVSGDGDLKQLAYYENVRFFNIYKKCKGSRGMYELISNPLKILADKAKKGDVSDNIIPSINDTEEDFELRYMLVNLLKLPVEIEDSITNEFKKLKNKEKHLAQMPFTKMADKFLTIYDKKYQITEEYCYALETKRIARKKKEKNKTK